MEKLMKATKCLKNRMFSITLISSNLFSGWLGLDLIYQFQQENVSIVYAEGESMLPTFENGSYFIMNSDEASINHITHNDFITFDTRIGKNFLKRVIAVGGDTVEIKDSALYVNGTLVEEDYINESEWGMDESDKIAWDNDNKIIVPDGEYFVLGDNRNHSTDSRSFGIRTIKKEDIIGVVRPINKQMGEALYNCQQSLKH